MSMQNEIKKKSQPKPIDKDDFGYPVKKNMKKKNTFLNKIIITLAVLVIIFSVGILAFDFFQNYSNEKKYQQYSSLYSSMTESTTPTQSETSVAEDNTPRPLLHAAADFLKINPDTVGWIKIENTKISYPVVLRPGENDYYLTHNFDGQKARAGAVFADYRTTIQDRKQSDNIVLYAHNEMNNTMFGDLDLYKSKGGKNWGDKALEFYKQNPTFEFNTNYEQGIYKIFAVFVTETKQENDPDYPLFDYNNYIDFDQNRYNQFIENINLRNKIVTDIDCKFGDKFVTLSTCSNETDSSRMVVIGRKVRPGEASNVNTDMVKWNENAHSPDWNAVYNH